MYVDQARPTLTLQRKRTFHDLTEATSSLALQTPLYRTPDPHYQGDYFAESGSSSPIRPFFQGSDGDGTSSSIPSSAADPDRGIATTTTTERSISPSKRVRILARPSSSRHSRHGSSASLSLATSTSSPDVPPLSSIVLPPATPMDTAQQPAFFTEPGTVAPGRLIPASQNTVAFPLAATLARLASDGVAPTANWGRYTADDASPALLYVPPSTDTPPTTTTTPPTQTLGRFYEPLVRLLLRLDASVACAASLQALGLCASPPASLSLVPGCATTTAEELQQLARVLPVHHQPEQVAFLLQAASYLLAAGSGTAARLCAEGFVVLLDGAGRVRLVLPLVDLGDVEGVLGLGGEGEDLGLGEMGGYGAMVRAVWALDALIRDALGQLGAEAEEWRGRGRAVL